MRYVPNVLTSLRLALACVFPLIDESWRLPAIIAGALSDWVDGLIARRYKAITASGTLLDAVADKLFTLSVLITLVASGDVVPWHAAVVLARDIIVTAIACYALLIGRFDGFRHMRPRMTGKLATTLAFLWMVSMVAPAPDGVRLLLLVVAGGASLIAALDYLAQFVRRYDEVERQGAGAASAAPRTPASQ
jgi:phosphatidylglycerophosphate synthase